MANINNPYGFRYEKNLNDEKRFIEAAYLKEVMSRGISVGYNFKYTDLQAAVALGQWTRLSRRNARMRAIYRAYRRGLRGVRGIELLPFDVASGETPLWIDALAVDRDRLVRHLEKRGAGVRKFWHPLHTQKPYRRSGRATPVSRRLSPRALWLPSAFGMSDRDIARVCRWISEFYA